MRDILHLDNKEARKYFMKEEQYCTLDLPEYYSFQNVLNQAKKSLGRKRFYNVLKSCDKNNAPFCFDDVNYSIINNKKAKYKWRKIELIHPVFYVGIVNDITTEENWDHIKQRFEAFRKNESIVCCSIPLIDSRRTTVVLNWWNAFEQRSIANAIDYSYVCKTDISNCYPSIYTHSIAWAIDTKPLAKAAQHKYSFLGNRIDKYIRDMHYGQTNGIPQGSTLMDFIAEIVLGYSDELLSERLESAGLEDYKIIRYRDDYRIFANDPSDIEEIIKQLAIVLDSLNLSINAEKTSISNNVINESVKEDKLFRITNPLDKAQSLERRLLSIYETSLRYPNSGIVRRELTDLYNECFFGLEKRPNSYEQLISIVLEIMNKNPSTYPICVGILSEILKFLRPETIRGYVARIIRKFQKEPFSDYLEIWLQRITLYYDREHEYKCSLCQKIYSNNSIWNSTWLETPIEEDSIINEEVIAAIKPNLSKNEVDKFSLDYEG